MSHPKDDSFEDNFNYGLYCFDNPCHGYAETTEEKYKFQLQALRDLACVLFEEIKELKKDPK